MPGIIRVDTVRNPGNTVNLSTQHFQRRLIQRVSRRWEGGLWNPGNTYYEIPGSFVNITPLYDESYISYTFTSMLAQRGTSAHAITHWIFTAAGQEYGRHSRSMDHLESGNILRFEIPSWGKGRTGGMGFFARQYGDGTHSVHFNSRRYIDGIDSSRAIPVQVSAEEYLPAYGAVFAPTTGLGSSPDNFATSAQALRDAGITTDGVYWIRPTGSLRAVQHYCRFIGALGYMMVFKKSAGYRNDPSDLWYSGGFNQDNVSVLNLNKSGDYSSPFITSSLWGTIAPNRARIELRDEDNVLRSAHEWNSAGSSPADWMTQGRVATSDWSGLATGTYNFFNIEGDPVIGRRWFINRTYGGCDLDTGYMVLKGDGGPGCNWDNQNRFQILAVPSGSTAQRWDPSNNGNQVYRHDMMVVFVR